MEILYSDPNIVVCIKPVGLDSEKDMPQALTLQCGGSFFPVHRLDQNVGGVMVYARNTKTAAHLSSAITEGSFVKEYLAIVHGIVPDGGDWQDILFKDSRKNKVYVVKTQRKGAKPARLTYTRLSSDDRTSLVRIRLYTGRSHQIRVQFSSRGFPLVGDHKYGSRATEKSPMLFSHEISFPYEGRLRSFCACPDWEMAQRLAAVPAPLSYDGM